MGKVHFIGGEKGGVGKSMTARVLAQYYIDHERPFPRHVFTILLGVRLFGSGGR